VFARGSACGIVKPPAPVELDRVPLPSYATYFDAVRAHRIEPRIAIEASRGCWWGQKHHCTFCGIAPQTMTFRAKSPEVVLAEMMELSRRHGVLDFIFTDYIMDHRYFDSFLPLLEQAQCGFQCFFELKANVTREQVEALGRAGVRTVQPGIESFSTRVLELMQKGTTGLQNVQLLRWCRELTLRPVYNVLFGFPGESAADYELQIDLVESILHLPPPEQVGPLVVHRYSPLFKGTARENFTNVRPRGDYRFLFHPDDVTIADLAYEHEADPPEGASDLTRVAAELSEAAARWQSRWARDPPRLEMRLGPGFVSIEDTRGAEPCVHTLEGAVRSLYLALWDRPRNRESLQRDLRHDGRSLDPSWIDDTLDALAGLRLAWTESGRWLALAVPHAVHRRVSTRLADVGP
jgi:ribosomal peptide maturation radical SAM protein 1